MNLRSGKTYNYFEKCDAVGCRGGRGFTIRNKTFCSPSCGNDYFNLSVNDTDFWPSDSEEEEEQQIIIYDCDGCGLDTPNDELWNLSGTSAESYEARTECLECMKLAQEEEEEEVTPCDRCPCKDISWCMSNGCDKGKRRIEWLEEEEEELKCLGFRPQTRMGECAGCKMVCEECENLMIVEEEE